MQTEVKNHIASSTDHSSKTINDLITVLGGAQGLVDYVIDHSKIRPNDPEFYLRNKLECAESASYKIKEILDSISKDLQKIK